jgi:hypothetical protein
MSIELLNLCHSVIEHAAEGSIELDEAKKALDALHEEGGIAQAAQDYAEDHMGEIAIKVLANLGLPFIGAELVGLAIDKYNESQQGQKDES